jgi:hypothetical protein
MARKPAKKSRKRTTSNARKPHAKPSPEPAVVSVSPDLLDPLQRAAAAVDPSAMSEVGHVRYATFVESTDPRVTICEAWKALMQFRHELLTNPRQDSGAEGWWSVWVGTMQRWLYGGGDWGYGYYGPSHRITTPDCAVGRNDKTRLFPANTTYAHNGFVIDWGKPFPPIPERGPIVEWVESWIDRIQYTEATGRYPWEPDAPPTPTVSVSPDLLDRVAERAAEKMARVFGAGDNDDTKPPALPAGGVESAGPALTVNQSRVLQTMARFDASRLLSSKMIVEEMDAATRLSEETVRQCVGKLIESNLAERPEGDRSGARLNSAGRKLAGKIAD